MAKKKLSRRKGKHVGSMEWEKPTTDSRLELPEDVLRKTCEEWAKKVRDGVNSQLGRDRLKIKMFHPWHDQSVQILMVDTDAPEGYDRLVLGWDLNCEADETIRFLVEADPQQALNTETEEQPNDN